MLDLITFVFSIYEMCGQAERCPQVDLNWPLGCFGRWNAAELHEQDVGPVLAQ